MSKQVFNPYLPSWEYIPDGEPKVFGDRLYIFGSHDRFDGDGYCENDYVAWSTPVDDLSAWRYEGVILRKDQTPWNIKNEPYYAPDVVQGNDGRYYLYYFVANSSIISVAVCDTPAGKYEYLGDVHMEDGHTYGSKPDEWFTFDPGVLVDDDKRIWLYTGSGQDSNGQYGHKIKGCFVLELDQDMLTVISEPKVLLPANWTRKEPNFFEGASIRHIGDWYYLVYPATDMTGLNYSMSKYPDREFVYKGRIHCTSDIGFEGRKLMGCAYPIGNNHGGLVCVNNQWYIFDHRMTNGSQWNRQGVAEPIQIKADGTIDMVEATSCGLNNGPLKGQGSYPAYICCNLISKKVFGLRNPTGGPKVTQDGEDYVPEEPGNNEITGETECNAPVSYIKDITKGCQIGYKFFDFTNTTSVSVETRNAKGKIQILDQLDGKVIAEEKLKEGADWTKTVIEFNPVMIFKGKKNVNLQKCPLFFRYHGTGSMEMLSFELN
ncbi:family 43 glycosylhydrolase [Anaerobium acetethylicum]|uniref:Glycosyl hydrolases family 43 n=1 Tax=Anaerobium acetethylicum TaxID=1619234 RepID=A0A1D3TX20_9FIRM|nr:family 43 glycosylhydrolase [Anaerobium acetethylicum]SCP98825.1 Glycosyl hydrolases family 43 [Anaerobium acetethylicum]